MEKNNIIGAIPLLGTPKKLPNYEHLYGIKQPAIVGRIYQTKCPECNGTVILSPKDTKPMKTHCIYCKAIIVTKAVTREEVAKAPEEPAPVASPKKESQPAGKQKEKTAKPVNNTMKVKMGKGLEGKAKLVWGGLFNRKKYILHKGENTIGRRDAERPSDLMFDDEYMSRQSVKIEVQKAAKGNFYKLTVLRTANPVLVNGEELKEGDNVYINFGDTIAMGYNTFLTFKSE